MKLRTGLAAIGVAAVVAALTSCATTRPAARALLTDCAADCPEMVAIPPGSYAMGSPPDETDRQPDEGPVHTVHIRRSFAVSKYPVTVAQFASFVAATGYDAGNDCWTVEDGKGEVRAGRNWREPGFPQTGSQPVVCVSWHDAQAYAAWLTRRTGHRYRLPTEAEYEYINRAGTTTAYWWGTAAGSGHANCVDCGSAWDNRQTSPVGSFAPNPFGLYDTAGNVWSWTQDCYHDTYATAPADGTADEAGDCSKRAVRGGFWTYLAKDLRSANRFGIAAESRRNGYGFRVARDLT